MIGEPILEWDSYSREPIERSEDWFWGLIVIAAFAAVASLIFGNILLAIIIILGAFSLYRHEKNPGDPFVHVRIDKRGVVLNKELFTYEKIRSFWIEEKDDGANPVLIITYERLFVPHIHIPIVGPSVETIRETLKNFGEEEKHQETLSEYIFKSFGF